MASNYFAILVSLHLLRSSPTTVGLLFALHEDEPVVLDRRSPVLHLVQMIRDESHRFAIGYHRQRRAMRDRSSELLEIPGVGPQTRQRLLTHFGSLRDVQQATAESLAAVVSRKTAETIWRHFHREAATGSVSSTE